MKMSHNENSQQTMNTMEFHQSYIGHLFLKKPTAYIILNDEKLNDQKQGR